jgi:hypothetical protein
MIMALPQGRSMFDGAEENFYRFKMRGIDVENLCALRSIHIKPHLQGSSDSLLIAPYSKILFSKTQTRPLISHQGVANYKATISATVGPSVGCSIAGHACNALQKASKILNRIPSTGSTIWCCINDLYSCGTCHVAIDVLDLSVVRGPSPIHLKMFICGSLTFPSICKSQLDSGSTTREVSKDHTTMNLDINTPLNET